MKTIVNLIVIASLALPTLAVSDVSGRAQDAGQIIQAKKYCKIKNPDANRKRRACISRVDPDSDNIRSKFDNCDLVSNRSQVDTDNDAIGDACEIVDLAVVSTDNYGSVSIFKDVKNKKKPYGLADVTLDRGFHCPRSVALSKPGRLFVSDECNNQIHIFSDIMTVTSGQESEIQLDADNRHPSSSCNFYYPSKLLISKGDLYAFDNNYNCLQIFRNADTLTSSSIADAAIEPGYDMYDFTIDEVNDQLIFSQYANNDRVNEPLPTTDSFVYKNISTRTGILVEPDLELDFGGTGYLYAYNNHLYSVQNYQGMVSLIKDAGNLSHGQAADTYLVGLDSGLYRPYAVVEIGTSTFISNEYRQSGAGEVASLSRVARDQEPAGTVFLNDILAGFYNIESVNSFQTPNVELSPVNYGRAMLELGGSLFMVADNENYVGAIFDGYSMSSTSAFDLKLINVNGSFANPYALAGRVR